MLTYDSCAVQLQEVPNEISLSFYICDCPHHCIGCSSPWLREPGSIQLTKENLLHQMAITPYFSCVTFMGGDEKHKDIIELTKVIHEQGKRVCMYSGDDFIDKDLADVLDYYKLGHWDASKGPLNDPNTNQRMYEKIQGNWKDITSSFWRKEALWKPQQEKHIND